MTLLHGREGAIVRVDSALCCAPFAPLPFATTYTLKEFGGDAASVMTTADGDALCERGRGRRQNAPHPAPNAAAAVPALGGLVAGRLPH